MSISDYDSSDIKHISIHIEGIVQGVGFRPFVYNLARKYKLSGNVRNTTNGVYIHAEGLPANTTAFYDELSSSPPPLAKIESIHCIVLPPEYFTAFRILESDPNLPKQTLVSPDAAICSDCLREIHDPEDRRYRYPFTNCTNCGPRYSIIRDIPYDRPLTTMAAFPMCPDCAEEYHDPGNRRFHAQPNACPVCGPAVSFFDISGNPVSGFWLDELRKKILEGHIIGIKSLGGFHLACRADSADVIQKLRTRKRRPAKPFAMMCRDLDVVRSIAEMTVEEEMLLSSPQSPIVLLRIKNNNSATEAISPGLSTVGIMLPYTPLHSLLFSDEISAMIMTSGNRNSLPLSYQNEAAFSELGGLADYLLLHDREIQNRCDDSVLSIYRGKPYFFRRSRGYAPLPVQIPFACNESVLALGSDMKNTYCILRGKEAFLGPHIGDLYNEETLEYYIRSFEDMKVFLDTKPEITAHDLHPSYMSTQVALRSTQLKKPVAIQHHHAHMASCMAENQIQEPVLGIILDGTGFGHDRNIWGFEILHGDYKECQRMYHLEELPIPGGEAAIHSPWRMACSYLWHYLDENNKLAKSMFARYSGQVDSLFEIWQRRINSPITSSCGRFFDAVSAMLNICTEISYEGQAAIELMETGDFSIPYNPYPFEISGSVISPSETIAKIVEDILSDTPAGVISARFHHTIAEMVVTAAILSRRQTKCSKVVLSGGVFQNEQLLSQVTDRLTDNQFQVYIHRKVPTNDGGIALGQAVVACSLNKCE